MSRTEIIAEIPRLSHADRKAIMRRLLEMEGDKSVDLRERGIGKAQAADLRARLKTFAGDWERPEADIYDENPAR